MKWYAYPLALVAWLLIAIFLFIIAWNLIGDHSIPDWSYYLLYISGGFLLSSFILAKISLSWELDVFIQAALVLGPLLWYLNERDPYKAPVYVFLIEAGYTGDVKVEFLHDENSKTKVGSTADSLFFRFNSQGEILLNEDFRTVRESLERNFYYLYPDGTRKKLESIKKGETVVSDSTRYIFWEDTLAADKGQTQYMIMKLRRADNTSGN
ncbi:MAG: hypothetical protein L6Q81_09250 [Bacteroidia bacterium]|nr:hypothetical protein [Bacteroidia bacterium]